MSAYRGKLYKKLWICNPLTLLTDDEHHVNAFPVKNLSSQLTHLELTWKSQKVHPAWVTVSPFWGHLSSSQCAHKMRLQLACFTEFAAFTVSPLQPLHGESSDDLRNISQRAHGVSLKFFELFCFSQANDKHIQANSQKDHSNLRVWVIRWALCELVLAHTITGLAFLCNSL